jgi:predicted alpha-1,2-mannosidase
MKKTLFALLMILAVSLSWSQESQNLIKQVNPLIGTKKMGHTYPGATVPFGMVQLSPDTDTLPYEVNGKYNPDVYKYCAGYQYEDKTIVGFSHTHFSGTGHSDLGDFLIMPTQGKLQLNPGTADNPESGYRSKFSHKTEVAEPGYYQVELDDHHIQAAVTTTTRVGFHDYMFRFDGDGHIILDMMHGIYNYEAKNVWTYIRYVNDTLITGYRQTQGWARTRTVYFAMAFSRPVQSYGFKNYSQEVYKGFWRKFDQENNFPEMAARQVKAYFNFDIKSGDHVKIKFAISPVSIDGAILNMNTEVPHWDFQKSRKQAQQLWENELSRFTINTLDGFDLMNFYTAVYHTYLGPTVYMDVDGKYKGIDQNIHQADGFTNYSTFSLWDTYRALHPWFNLVQRKRNSDMIRSMLAHQQQSPEGMLPIWSHHGNENWCMIGYHSVSVIADAVAKKNYGFDMDDALRACTETATYGKYDGLEHYMKLGYVPEDKSGSSVSKTLEYAYNDWCIANLAKDMNKAQVYNEFIKRSGNFRNVFDSASGFSRPRLANGIWKREFDPLDTHGQGFIEGNSWNYSLYVPHDVPALIRLMGGEKRFIRRMDSLFTMELPDKYFAQTEDITRDGIIGNYVHGNEPAHHAAYLYNWTQSSWKTQERVRMIMKKMYKPQADGLGGNDDCGQMSAWYLFSMLGFYPVAPGSEEYALGSPGVVSATIKLENGKELKIETVNQSKENVYVKKVLLNGKELKRPFFNHSDILDGGTITFHLSPKLVK